MGLNKDERSYIERTLSAVAAHAEHSFNETERARLHVDKALAEHRQNIDKNFAMLALRLELVQRSTFFGAIAHFFRSRVKQLRDYRSKKQQPTRKMFTSAAGGYQSTSYVASEPPKAPSVESDSSMLVNRIAHIKS